MLLSDFSSSFVLVSMLLKHVAPGALHKFYKLPVALDEFDATEFLTHFSRQKGRLGKGGVPHLEAAARIVLGDWNLGRIPYASAPPQMEGVVSSTIVKSNLIQLVPSQVSTTLHLAESSSEDEEEEEEMDSDSD